MSNPRVGLDLMDWLRKSFPPRGIQEGESEIAAHRYAAKVELAQRLISMGKADPLHDVEEED